MEILAGKIWTGKIINVLFDSLDLQHKLMLIHGIVFPLLG